MAGGFKQFRANDRSALKARKKRCSANLLNAPVRFPKHATMQGRVCVRRFSVPMSHKTCFSKYLRRSIFCGSVNSLDAFAVFMSSKQSLSWRNNGLWSYLTAITCPDRFQHLLHLQWTLLRQRSACCSNFCREKL